MTYSMSNYFGLLQRYWKRLQVRHVLLVAVFLFVVKEQYPFSDFPMYSRLDAESDVLFVTDQNDQPLPMHTLFGTGTANQKKVFMAELKKICNPKNRDTKHALLEEQREAGEKMVEKLLPKLKRERLVLQGDHVTQLRFYYKVFTLDGESIAAGKPVLVAEHTL